MRLLFVLAQALAVIAGHGHEWRGAAAEPGVLIEDRAEGLVGERDFPIVWPACERLPERRRRIS